MSIEARLANRSILDEAAATSDPTLRGVFNEDAVSVAGDVSALTGLATNQITGSSIPQAIAALLIGLVLVRISLRLVNRNHDFLLGRPIQAYDRDRVRYFLLDCPGVTAIRELLVTYIGPSQVWVIARTNIEDHLRGDQVTSLVSGIERSLKRQSTHIYRVDVVTVGEDPASSSTDDGRPSPEVA